jgi:hypothetical protein
MSLFPSFLACFAQEHAAVELPLAELRTPNSQLLEKASELRAALDFINDPTGWINVTDPNQDLTGFKPYLTRTETRNTVYISCEVGIHDRNTETNRIKLIPAENETLQTQLAELLKLSPSDLKDLGLVVNSDARDKFDWGLKSKTTVIAFNLALPEQAEAKA